MAKLYFKYGAMNSGKTTMLIQRAYNYEEQGQRVLIMKPSIDVKGEDNIVSRLGVTRKVDYLLSPEDDIIDIVNGEIWRIDCIFVDEAQFLTPRQAEQLFMITTGVYTAEIPVICYGLRSDFLTKGFAGSTRLLELAHSIEEIKTICRCGRKAVFNTRKVNGRYIFEGDQVAIDGERQVTYKSLCAKCYFEEKAKASKKDNL